MGKTIKEYAMKKEIYMYRKILIFVFFVCFAAVNGFSFGIKDIAKIRDDVADMKYTQKDIAKTLDEIKKEQTDVGDMKNMQKDVADIKSTQKDIAETLDEIKKAQTDVAKTLGEIKNELSKGAAVPPIIDRFEIGKYYVQLASYRNPESVKAEIAKIGNRLPVAIMKSNVDIRGEKILVHRILIGPVDYNQSRDILKNFKSTYNDAFIWLGR
jgi:septal ring factor EnvC (AmiA/AmiB activator)